MLRIFSPHTPIDAKLCNSFRLCVNIQKIIPVIWEIVLPHIDRVTSQGLLWVEEIQWSGKGMSGNKIGFAVGYDKNATIREMAASIAAAEGAGFDSGFFSETLYTNR